MAKHRISSGIRPAVVAAIGAACLLTPPLADGRAAPVPAAPPQLVLRAPAPIDPQVAHAARRGMAEYLVLLDRPGADAVAVEAAVAPLEASGHVAETDRYPLVGVVAVTGDATSLEAVARRPDVAAILPNRLHRLEVADTSATPASTAGWNLDLVGAERAWHEMGANGQGVVVATIDSGADWLHPALRTRYRGRGGEHDYSWMDFSRPASPRDRPSDGNGHGTQVLGVMVGGNGDEPMGVAPGAEWISVRAFDAYGFSTDKQLLRAAEWLLAPTKLDGSAPRPDLAPDIVNCSWVLENGADPLFDAMVTAWRKAGILPVFAAGNSDDGTRTTAGILAPASNPDVIAVGALRPSGAVWELSKGGPSFSGAVKPDVVAPGVGVRTARNGGGTIYGTGTSMASPHVAGTAALMLSASPGLGVGDLAFGLRATARDIGTVGPDNISGWGAVDALRAAEWSLRSGRIAGRATDLSGGSITGAQVHVAFSGPGGSPARSVMAGGDGAYSVAVAPGRWTVSASSLRHLSEETQLDVVPERTATLDLRLPPAPLGSVTGRVTGAFGQPLAGAGIDLLLSGPHDDLGDLDDLQSLAATRADGGYELSLPAGEHELRYGVTGHRAVTATVVSSPGVETVADASLAPAPRLLLVDADAYTGERINPYIGSALGGYGYEADVWTIDDPQDDLPGTEVLASYDVVLWLHVYDSPGRLDARRRDTAVSSTLESYVAGGGRLIISGQDIGRHDSDDTQVAGAAAPELFAELLRARFVEDDSGFDQVLGAGWLEGLSWDLGLPAGHDKGRRFSPDVVAPETSGDAGESAPLLQYPDGRAAALAIDSPEGRRAYLAFGPEGIGDPNALGSLYDRIVAWLESPWMSLGAEPGAVRTGDAARLRVDLRSGRAAAAGDLMLQVPPAWTIDAHPRVMEREAHDRVAWSGSLEPDSSRTFEVDARLVGPVSGGQPQVVTATLRSLGRTQIVSASIRAVAPDLEPSAASASPGRIAGPSTVEYSLAIENSGSADASDAEAVVLLPSGAEPVTDTLEASSGSVEWVPEGGPGSGRVLWRGTVRPDEQAEVRLTAALPDAPGHSHVFAAEIGDGLGRVVTRTAQVLAGGPDVSLSRVLPPPAVVLAGDAFDLGLSLVNSGALAANVTTKIDLPPGIEPLGVDPPETALLAVPTYVQEDLLAPGATRVVTVPLAVTTAARSGPRVIGVTLDDGFAPASPVRLEAATTVRRAELDGSTTILLPARVRSGDVVTATVFVSNRGDATVPVTVVDSLPPALVAAPQSAHASSGEVVVEPGTIKWTVDAAPAGDDYAWSHSPIRPTAPGRPVSEQTQPYTQARGPVPLGFGFPFYTDVYTQAWVADTGLLSFEPPNADRAPTLGPGGPDVPSVAPLWRHGSRGVRANVRRDSDATTFAWPAEARGGGFAVSLERGGVIRMSYGAAVDPKGSVVGLRAPDGHVLPVPQSEVAASWGLSFDPPGGWEWLSFSGMLGFALPPNSPVTHTVRLQSAGYDRMLTAGVFANRLRLDDSRLEVEPETPVPGSTVRYSLVVSPVGDVDAREVVVRVDPPATGSVVKQTLTGGLLADPEDDGFVWRGRVAAGATHVLGWSVLLPPDVRLGARIVAGASLQADGVPELKLSRAVRVRATDFSGSGKRSSHSVARPGEIVGFALRAANSGAEAAEVQLTDALPPGLSYVEGSARASTGAAPVWRPEAKALSWSGSVPAGSFASVHLEARFDGTGPATNAMWLSDENGTSFADWAEVVPSAHSVFLPAAARSASGPARAAAGSG